TALDRATGREIRAIAILQKVERMVPERHPRKDPRPLAATIDENKESASERGMQRVCLSAHPENIAQGDMQEAGQRRQRAPEKQRQIAKLFLDAFEKAAGLFFVSSTKAPSDSAWFR